MELVFKSYKTNVNDIKAIIYNKIIEHNKMLLDIILSGEHTLNEGTFCKPTKNTIIYSTHSNKGKYIITFLKKHVKVVFSGFRNSFYGGTYWSSISYKYLNIFKLKIIRRPYSLKIYLKLKEIRTSSFKTLPDYLKKIINHNRAKFHLNPKNY